MGLSEIKSRVKLLVNLGENLRNNGIPEEIMIQSEQYNPWFTLSNIRLAVESISTRFLNRNVLDQWINAYKVESVTSPKRVGIIMAGNIPLVGFHDFLCTFIAGHRSMIKLSSKDEVLPKYIFSLLTSLDSEFEDYVEIVEKLSGMDAVIATGGSNSTRYFEYYFSKIPSIIRSNRNAIAVLDGSETREELENLAVDIFSYFGLGCRNVSKIYVPRDYDFTTFMEVTHEYNELVLHNKFKNNFDYNYAIYLLNDQKFLANGCLIVKEDENIGSRIASVHFEQYDDLESVVKSIEMNQDKIQCVLSGIGGLAIKTVPFGLSQYPAIDDYADGVDTMDFLTKI